LYEDRTERTTTLDKMKGNYLVPRLIGKFLVRGPKDPANCVKIGTLRLEYIIQVILIHNNTIPLLDLLVRSMQG